MVDQWLEVNEKICQNRPVRTLEDQEFEELKKTGKRRSRNRNGEKTPKALPRPS
jgi:hypothetical protein